MCRYLNDLLASLLQARSHLLPLGFVRYHVQTNHREGRSDAHHHVGVIDRLAIRADAGEDDWLVAEGIGKALDHLGVGAVWEGHVRNFFPVVEPKAALA